MNHNWRVGIIAITFGLASVSTTAGAQTVHRNTKVTGPKGKSIERQIDVTRTPGHVERDVKITRPGGTFERDTIVNRTGGVPRTGGGYGPGRPGGVVERDVFIERDYIFAPPPPPRAAFGIGGPSFGLFLGGPVLPPPPPIVVIDPYYGYPAPPPTVIVQPPVRYAPPAQPQVIVADPVAAAMDRLKSNHNHSRRDGALTLGRLGDARAVPALIERIEKDWEKEVRVAAAWALGEIGDPRAAICLQKAMLYDKKNEVRDAASIGYKKLGRETIDNTNIQVVPRETSAISLGLPEALPAHNRSLDPPPPPRPESPK